MINSKKQHSVTYIYKYPPFVEGDHFSLLLEVQMNGGVDDSAVADFVLIGQTLQGVDGSFHSVHGEEGCQVGCVHGSHSKREKPPEGANDAT